MRRLDVVIGSESVNVLPAGNTLNGKLAIHGFGDISRERQGVPQVKIATCGTPHRPLRVPLSRWERDFLIPDLTGTFFYEVIPAGDNRRMFRRTHFRFVLLLVVAALLQSCSTPGKPAESQTPAQFKVLFQTSRGGVIIEVTRDWSPHGADRFYTLVKDGFFDGAEFFRVLRSPVPFMAQFGINGDPKITAKWAESNIPDDPVIQHNTRGMVSFATAGPNTRTTQLFINYTDNLKLDDRGFSPIGKVISGMEAVDQFYADYGEGAPNGAGPDQSRIEQEGNAYLKKEFPNLDYIKTAKILE